MMSQFLKAVFAFCLLLSVSDCCIGAVIVTPSDLAPGANYYLVMITGSVFTGASSNIADYDAFVNSEVAQNTDLAGITWKALGSTSTVSARDHLGIGNFPIYRLDGVRIADNATDLWDGSIAVTGMTTYNGFLLPNSFVWTGSNPDGTASTDYLGSATAVFGFTARSDAGWITHQSGSTATGSGTVSGHRMLGFSQMLTVGGPSPAVPEPSAMIVWGLVTSMGAMLSRRRLQKDRAALA